MMTAPDFPYAPTFGQLYTTPSGIVYVWTGQAWTIGFYDSQFQTLTDLSDLLDQVRTLLQDTDNTSTSGYRYSTDSIVTNLNQGMTDLFRIRPDLFLEQGFRIPVFNSGSVSDPIGIEEQYISPLIFYVVGLTQARDDEQTQDARAGVFLKTFKDAVLTVS